MKMKPPSISLICLLCLQLTGTHEQPTATTKTKSTTQSSNTTTTTSDYPCGQQVIRQEYIRNGRVVGGQNSYLGEFPWTASIRFPDRHHCGGTILNENWILTAAHCVIGYGPSEFRVKLGSNQNQGSDEASLELEVNDVIVHELFAVPRSMANDIALLRLKSPINFTDYMLPICLPPEEEEERNSYTGTKATVVGWGWTSYEPTIFPPGQSPEILQKVDLRVIPIHECMTWFRSRGKSVTLDMKQFCAGYKDGGKDSCRGDSGGPLLIRKDSTDTYYIIGIVSAGIGCAEPRLPGVYTRVSAYLPWIRKHIQEEF